MIDQRLIEACEYVYNANPLIKSRKREYVFARMACYIEIYKTTPNKLAISRMFRNTNASVINGINNHYDLYGKDKEYTEKHDRFMSRLGYEVKSKPITADEISAMKEKRKPLKDLLDEVPDDRLDDVFVKVQAIVRMSKVKHVLK